MPTEQNNTYPQNAEEATLRLQTSLKQQILENGPLSFTEFMSQALYHPHWGYYTRGSQNVGKSGDFYTSVSIGSCFGLILAHRIHQHWQNLGKNEQTQPFHLIEMGANNGQLAKDILDTLATQFPALYACTSYHIPEHLENIQHTQQQTLAAHQAKIHHHRSLAEIQIPNSIGILLSNELIDAFPVHLIQRDQGVWKQRLVDVSEDQLSFTLDANLSPELENFTSTLAPDLADGYQTEYRPGLESHAQDVSRALTKSLTITIDYGHTHSSYYTPARRTGTLRCYHQHRADEAPLESPGLKDITAHVEFTQLAAAYRQHGHSITQFSLQSRYLIHHARQWLLSLESAPDANTPKMIRQFQSLTHPTTMGHQFMVLETSNFLPENPEILDTLELH